MIRRFLSTIALSLFVLTATFTLNATPVFSANMEPEPKLSEKEFATGKRIYFERCAGCHGLLRKGSTGPNLEPKRTRDPKELGLEKIERTITEGTKGGMPALGREGYYTEDEIEIIAPVCSAWTSNTA